MNSTESTRRRANSSLASSSSVNDNCSDAADKTCSNCQNNAVRRRSSRQPNCRSEVGRLAGWKGQILNHFRVLCNNIGKLRVVDVALFVGFSAKVASMLYSRRCPVPSLSPSPSSPPALVLETNDPVAPSADKTSFSSKWQKMWTKHKMPFQSPLLYRREDDDYSFGYDSYLDDDQIGRIQPKQTMNKFRGMFLRDRDFEKKKHQLNAHGYIIVDDILYNSNTYRETTEAALMDSSFYVNHPALAKPMDESYPAFELRNREELHHHHIVDDDWDHYYSFDDDVKRGTTGMGLNQTDDEIQELHEQYGRGSGTGISVEQGLCTLPEFYRLYKPTCNEMHAMLSGYHWLIGEDMYSRRWVRRKHSLPDNSRVSKYLARGYYRHAFLVQQSVSFAGEGNGSTQWDEVVFKTMHHMYETEGAMSNDDEMDKLGLGFDPDDKYTFTNYKEYMRMDAMVMEQLTSSPRAINIYSHCAMSSVIEFAPVDMQDYIMPTIGYTPKKIMRRGAKYVDEWDGPLNNYISPEEKLEIALEMAKCLAVMHGYEGGPIVNVDVQVGQFFRGRDGMIKIVDFNRAEPLMYDTQNKKYCKWTNGEPTDGQVSYAKFNIVLNVLILSHFIPIVPFPRRKCRCSFDREN